MSHPPLLILDTETLGLSYDAPVWEIAAIRVNENGRVDTAGYLQMFVDHDPGLMDPGLPESFQADYKKRFIDATPLVVNQESAVNAVRYAARGRALVCGSNPAFDMQKLEKMARDNGLEPLESAWHYHGEDVPTLARGWLNGKGIYPAPPWKSDLISQMCGVDPREYDRHTAAGDCSWMWDLWKAIQR